MKAADDTSESKTFIYKTITDLKNDLKLESLSFKIEQKTAPPIGKPEGVKNYHPVICPARSSQYQCKKRLVVSIDIDIY